MENSEREEALKKYVYLKKANLESFIWEFIRRNKDYKEAYQKYQSNKKYWNVFIFDLPKKKRVTEPLSWYSITPGRRVPRFKILFNPFGLDYPLNPLKGANDKEVKRRLRGCLRRVYTPVFYDFSEDPDITKSLKKEWSEVHKQKITIEVLIDITAPIEKIQSEVEKIIKEKRERIEAENTVPEYYGENFVTKKNFKKRVRKEWIKYLIAYDLKEQGYKIRNIAKLLYPEEDDGYPDFPVSKKIHRFVKEAKHLIDKEYKEFLF